MSYPDITDGNELSLKGQADAADSSEQLFSDTSFFSKDRTPKTGSSKEAAGQTPNPSKGAGGALEEKLDVQASKPSSYVSGSFTAPPDNKALSETGLTSQGIKESCGSQESRPVLNVKKEDWQQKIEPVNYAVENRFIQGISRKDLPQSEEADLKAVRTTMDQDYGNSYSKKLPVNSEYADTYGKKLPVNSEYADTYGKKLPVNSEYADTYGKKLSVNSEYADTYGKKLSVNSEYADTYANTRAVSSEYTDAYSKKILASQDLGSQETRIRNLYGESRVEASLKPTGFMANSDDSASTRLAYTKPDNWAALPEKVKFANAAEYQATLNNTAAERPETRSLAGSIADVTRPMANAVDGNRSFQAAGLEPGKTPFSDAQPGKITADSSPISNPSLSGKITADNLSAINSVLPDTRATAESLRLQQGDFAPSRAQADSRSNLSADVAQARMPVENVRQSGAEAHLPGGDGRERTTREDTGARLQQASEAPRSLAGISETQARVDLGDCAYRQVASDNERKEHEDRLRRVVGPGSSPPEDARKVDAGVALQPAGKLTLDKNLAGRDLVMTPLGAAAESRTDSGKSSSIKLPSLELVADDSRSRANASSLPLPLRAAAENNVHTSGLLEGSLVKGQTMSADGIVRSQVTESSTRSQSAEPGAKTSAGEAASRAAGIDGASRLTSSGVKGDVQAFWGSGRSASGSGADWQARRDHASASTVVSGAVRGDRLEGSQGTQRVGSDRDTGTSSQGIKDDGSAHRLGAGRLPGEKAGAGGRTSGVDDVLAQLKSIARETAVPGGRDVGLRNEVLLSFERAGKPGGQLELPGLEIALASLLITAGVARVRPDGALQGEAASGATVGEDAAGKKEAMTSASLSGDDAENDADSIGASQKGFQADDKDRLASKAKILHRPHYLVQSNDTLVSIAEAHFHDASIAWLIADLNAKSIKELWVNGKRVVELRNRQQLELPVWEDIVEYKCHRSLKACPENLITIVNETKVDKELVEGFLSSAMGVAARSSSPVCQPGEGRDVSSEPVPAVRTSSLSALRPRPSSVAAGMALTSVAAGLAVASASGSVESRLGAPKKHSTGLTEQIDMPRQFASATRGWVLKSVLPSRNFIANAVQDETQL